MSLQSANKLVSATISLSEVRHLDLEIHELLSDQADSAQIVELLKKRYGNSDRLGVTVANDKVELKWTLTTVDAEAETCHKNALAFARKKEFTKAIAKWTQAVSKNPHDPDYYFNLGLAFFENKNYREAIENLNQVIAICPIYHRAHLILGTLLLKTRKFEEAENHLKESIYFTPRNPLAHLNLGAVYSILKKHKEAIASFQRTIELSPKEVRAYFGLAKIYSILGDTENATINYRKVIELDEKGGLIKHAKKGLASANVAAEPTVSNDDAINIEDLETLFAEGYKSFLYSDFQMAAKMYKKYLEKKPQDDQVWSTLGTALQRAGALDQALAAFERATKIKQSKGLYFKQLAIVNDFLDQPQEAVDAFAKANELGKDDSILYAFWGKNLSKLNRITEAIPHLERSVKLNKANLLGHLHLASALIKMGEVDRAVTHLETILMAKVNTPLKEEADTLLQKLRG